jgi:pimeloyl-ACP methyl ester carboxylesterase
VPTFASYDGTEIGYRLLGDGPPLVCIPGGPGRTADYLGNLGGLDSSRRLVLLDPRGVGLSADPADPATLRADRLVSDVESLRAHLGLGRMDLLAHSAGAILAPVLLQAGDLDPMVTPAMAREAAPLLHDAAVAVQPGAAHFPWVDDPAAFATAIGAFLT